MKHSVRDSRNFPEDVSEVKSPSFCGSFMKNLLDFWQNSASDFLPWLIKLKMHYFSRSSTHPHICHMFLTILLVPIQAYSSTAIVV
jgi:hypothetical protein